MSEITEKEKIAFTETLYILKNIEDEYYNKIPKDIINLFEANSIKYYQYYDKNMELKLSDLTKEILCFLNLEYLCNEREKNNLIKKYAEYDKLLKEKYDIYEIFKKRKALNENKSKEKIDENTNLISIKKSFWSEVFERIRGIFKKNNKK